MRHEEGWEPHGFDGERHGAFGLFEEIARLFGFDKIVEVFDGEFVKEEGREFDLFADEFEEGDLLFFERGKGGQLLMPVGINGKSD